MPMQTSSNRKRLILVLTMLASGPASGQVSSQPSGFDPPIRCNGSTLVQTCFLADGSQYTERLLERGRLVRDGVDRDGTRWTETEVREFDGTRTTGSDSRNRTWAFSYSPRFGTRGTNRGGPFFIPPNHRRNQDEAGSGER
jgi:hypothetical protein